jgi:hypothetical protein
LSIPAARAIHTAADGDDGNRHYDPVAVKARVETGGQVGFASAGIWLSAFPKVTARVEIFLKLLLEASCYCGRLIQTPNGKNCTVRSTGDRTALTEGQ